MGEDIETIDALGRRLAEHDPPRLQDLQAYDDYRAEFGTAMDEVEGAIRQIAEADLSPNWAATTSARLKAVDSVLRKLRRKTTSLSTMQDVAGCRLTVPTLSAQTAMAAG